MSYWFDLQTKVLEANNIKNQILAPRQYWCLSLDIFSEYFSEFVHNIGHDLDPKEPILILVDGATKSAGANLTIDVVTRKIFEDKKIGYEWRNASEVCGVKCEDLHASAKHLSKLKVVLGEKNYAAVVVLGSGSLTDLVKHAVFEMSLCLPLISIPTAISVTAYTSNFSVLEYSGAKRTKKSSSVSAVFWVNYFVSNAPSAMTRAGYGDLLAPFFAYADWWLSNELKLSNNYSEKSRVLLEPFFVGIKNNAAGVSRFPLDSDTAECMCAALGMAGIGMNVAGETAPFSGLEHAISHGLDFLRLTSNRPLVLHGEQVALSSLTSAKIFDWIVKQPKPDVKKWRQDNTAEAIQVLKNILASAPFCGEDRPTFSRTVPAKPAQHIIESIAIAEQEFCKDYTIKHNAWQSYNEKQQTITKNWPEITKQLKGMTIRFSELETLIKSANLPLYAEQTSPPTSHAELRWAVQFSPFIRTRASISDLLFWMGEDVPTIGAL